jgi:hypothetical protein
VIGNTWDEYSDEAQSQLFEDLFTIKKKSSFKARLITHWDFDKQTMAFKIFQIIDILQVSKFLHL